MGGQVVVWWEVTRLVFLLNMRLKSSSWMFDRRASYSSKDSQRTSVFNFI